MNLKIKAFLATCFTAIILISAVQLLDTYYFLPKTVLNINELPKSAEIIESGNNSSIGTQLFVNQWLLGISTEQLPTILSGHNYFSCTGVSKDSYVVANTLNRHKKFFYSNCYEFEDNSSDIRPLTRIYANSANTAILVEYQTD